MVGVLIGTAGNVHQPQKQIVVEIDDHLLGTIIAGKVDKTIFRPDIIHQIAHNLWLSAAESVNRLFNVTDAENVCAAGNQVDNRILQIIGILKFVDHDFIESFLVSFCGQLVFRG